VYILLGTYHQSKQAQKTQQWQLLPFRNSDKQPLDLEKAKISTI
jgi:hypothetical protein